MKVLIATPTWGEGPCPETCASVAALDGAGWEWRQYRANVHPAPDPRNVLAQYQAIRAEFLDGTWDALLTVEHDMILPPHALQALWETGAPVAYGVYLLRHGALVLNACVYVGERNMGESLTLRPPSGAAARGVVRVSGVGFGCTLMRREIVKRIPFTDKGDTGQSPDVPFAQECVRTGVLQVAHLGVRCGHLEGRKVLMPFKDDTTAAWRVRINMSINALVGGAVVALQEGQVVELPSPDADHLCRAGYATQLEDETDDAAQRGDADLQAPAHAPAQPGKPAKAKRS